MKKLSWEEVVELHELGELAGCFYLYDDDSEGEIPPDYTWEDILYHHELGLEFGLEYGFREENEDEESSGSNQ